MKISFDCYATARLHRVSDTPMDTAQMRAAGLDGLDDPEVEIAAYLDQPLIADEGLIDGGVRYWLDAHGDLHATLSFRCIPQLSASQIEVMSKDLVGQLLDGWGEGRLLDTPSGEVWIEWFEHGEDSDATFDVKQVDDGEPVADNRTPPAVKAAVTGDAKALQAALDSGSDVETRNRWGQPLLLLAASRGHEACVDLLVKRGAKVNPPEKGQTSALSLAAINGHADAVRRLLGAGADPSLGDKPPLHWAANRDHKDIALLLLDAGADRAAVDEQGETALFLARDPSMIRFLVEAGLDPRVKDGQGRTPLEAALESADFDKSIGWREGEKEWRAAAKELKRWTQ